MSEYCGKCGRLKTESNTAFYNRYCWWCKDRAASNREIE